MIQKCKDYGIWFLSLSHPVCDRWPWLCSLHPPQLKLIKGYYCHALHLSDQPIRVHRMLQVFYIKAVGASKKKWPLKILSKGYRWIHHGNWDSGASWAALAAHTKFVGLKVTLGFPCARLSSEFRADFIDQSKKFHCAVNGSQCDPVYTCWHFHFSVWNWLIWLIARKAEVWLSPMTCLCLDPYLP